MDANALRLWGKQMIDLAADYWESIEERPVLPTVKPGYIRNLLPTDAPEKPDSWENVMADVERVIMPGVTHWHSPHFHAYFPTANSPEAICADILSAAIGCIGFSWIASPACTELEVVMLDWLGRMIGLPEAFMSTGNGGGVIQGTASEATLVALLAARAKAVQAIVKERPEWTPSVVQSLLMAYTSEQAHSSVERAALLGAVAVKKLPCDSDGSLRGATLQAAIDEDRRKGLFPFFVCGTLGTTPTCSFDRLDEIGPVAKSEGIWLHVDAAYAGSAFVCPEFRHWLNGVEYAMSFNFNPHKWLLVNFDCSAFWLREREWLVDAFNVDPLYLKHQHQDQAHDYRHWQIPLGRRFRSLKLWFVMRMRGRQGLQAHIRKQVGLAHVFEQALKTDERFELVIPVRLGLVCFRYKGSNEINEKLLKAINDEARIHMVPSKVGDKFFLRFAVCSSLTEERHVQFAWMVIVENLAKVLTALIQ